MTVPGSTLERPTCLVPDLTGDVSRRRFLGAAGGIALLSACGSRNASGGGSAAADGFPREISHSGGRVLRLERRPERVFVYSPYAILDDALAVGAPLAGYISVERDQARTPWRSKEVIDAAAEIVSPDWDAVEEVLALQPDLIVVNSFQLTEGGDPGVTQLLDAGVPMLGLPDPLEDRVQMLGAATGREDAAAAAIRRSDEAIASFDPAWLPRSMALFEYYGPPGPSVFKPDSPTGETLRRIGLPPLSAGGNPDTDEISFELLDEVFDVELLVGVPYSEELAAELRADPIFTALPVVREGRYDEIDPAPSLALSEPSVLSIPYAVDLLTDVLRRTAP